MRSKADDPGQSGRQGESESGERSRQGESGQRGTGMQRQPSGSSLARRGWMRGGPLATPWDLMRRATAEMERMLEAIDSTGFAPGTAGTTGAQRAGRAEWIPQIEVASNPDSVTVRVDLPGVDLDEIDVGVEDNMLIVSGVRREEEREEREGFVRTEREYGRFFRAIPLPEGADESTIEATFDGGVLEIKVPVRGRQQGQRVPVSSGTSSTRSQQSQGTQSSQQSRSQQRT